MIAMLTQTSNMGLSSVSFKDFLLKQELLRAVAEAGFENPSEVQSEALPTALQGKDLLCQAKAGMGKTAVFCLAILNNMDHKRPEPVSALIIAPTKELCYQIHKEFERLGKYLSTIKSVMCVGGNPIDQDKEKIASGPAVVVGTPARFLDLFRRKIIKFDKLKFFVLDECDKLLEQRSTKEDITDIFTKTPSDKQVMMFSATYPAEVKKIASKFTQNPTEIFIHEQQKLVLEGILQYYLEIGEKEKTKKLTDLLDHLHFNQVIIFVSSVERTIELDKILRENNFPSMCVHSRLNTEERMTRFKQFKDGQGRILVSTDLFARGVDFARINIVFNYDMPKGANERGGDDADTYLHRVGRTGRGGTKGLAISFVAPDDEALLKKIQDRFLVKISHLPNQIDTDSYMNQS